jgi:hypothetical protein
MIVPGRPRHSPKDGLSAPPALGPFLCAAFTIKKAAGIGALRLPGSKIDVYEICPAPVQRAKYTPRVT